MAQKSTKRAGTPLAEYRRKRDFQKTSEPDGSHRVVKAKFARFVVQKHDARRLHYDLRLEVDGVFKSWAVTRGPSLDPKDKRLAVEVEDHPLAYGDFEGTIPRGEYGGGTVMIWDRGYWSVLGDKPAARALADGELKFVVAGSKLKGSWVLVRMARDRTRAERTNWLLIKHRDEWTRAGRSAESKRWSRSVASERTLPQIAAGSGAGPQPFMLDGESSAPPDAIWSSTAPQPPQRKDRSAMPKIARVTADGEVVQGQKITNSDKELWPSGQRVAVTKLQLAEYLATVGPWMVPHLKGRPCSLVRAPDGIAGESFFQRHAMKGTSQAGTISIAGDRKPYLQIESVDDLLAMAQLAALEFHPGNCAPFQPEVPGRLVFDLDPGGGVAFSMVVDAAKELRVRLERLGLRAFCKTTGGKGLHVVTPLQVRAGDNIGWEEAKTFAETICAQMAQDTPSRYLTKMTKKLRDGRIFLDYLRNDRLATAVAPLSPRARPDATVSMPLTWTQVRSNLDPKRFTVHTVPALLARSRAWHDYGRSERPLMSAIRALIDSAR